MYNLYYAMFGISVAIVGCMLHAAINRRWSALQGGIPLLIGFAVLTIVFGVAK
jgi:hypothetical protein